MDESFSCTERGSLACGISFATVSSTVKSVEVRQANQQKNVVKGTVTDESELPVPGLR